MMSKLTHYADFHRKMHQSNSISEFDLQQKLMKFFVCFLQTDILNLLVMKAHTRKTSLNLNIIEFQESQY
jgi:hypothetical protein